MSYQNPIRIFSPSQLEKLSPATLKKLKKEILLHFQLTDDLTIERNGQQFDKNEVLRIFQSLETDLELHLHIFQNKKLRDFLQDRTLAFFEDKEAQALVLADEKYRVQINDFIAEILNPVTAKLMNKVVFSTLSDLRKILAYCQNLDFAQQSRAYHNAYLSVQVFVDRLPEDYPSPYLHEDGAAFIPALNSLVNPLYYKCFQFLPDVFQQFGFKYAMWCHNNVVNAAFKRHTRFGQYQRADLVTIAKAQEIGINVAQSPGFENNKKILHKYLHGRDYSYDEKTDYWGIIKIIAIIVVAVMRLATLDSCGQSSSSRYAKLDYQDYRFKPNFPNRSINDIYNQKKSLQGQSADNASSSTLKTLLGKYTGDSPQQLNAEQTLVEEKDSTLYLHFTVDMLPTKVGEFSYLLSQEIKTKYLTGRDKDVVFSFRDRTILGYTLKHRFRSLTNGNGDYVAIRLKGTHVGGSSNGFEHKLNTKRLLKSNLLRGTITRYSTYTNRKLTEDHFEIRRGKNPVPNGEDAIPRALNEAQFERWEDYYIAPVSEKGYELSKYQLEIEQTKRRTSNNQAYKDVILNNLFRVSFKSLTYGRYYKLDNMAMVQPKNQTHYKTLAKQKATTDLKGSLSYYLNSAEAQVGIYSLNGRKFQLRYFISLKTRRIIGMHMVSVSEDLKIAELIEVFF